jgi:hypothetical protein
MLITWRRTGGLFASLALAAAAVATIFLAVGAAAIVVAAAAAIASAVALARAVLPRSWRKRTVLTTAPWPHDTIDTTAVNALTSADTHRFHRMDDSTR